MGTLEEQEDADGNGGQKKKKKEAHCAQIWARNQLKLEGEAIESPQEAKTGRMSDTWLACAAT